MKYIILPQKVATGTAYACLRPIEISFEQRECLLEGSTGASDVPLCKSFVMCMKDVIVNMHEVRIDY